MPQCNASLPKKEHTTIVKVLSELLRKSLRGSQSLLLFLCHKSYSSFYLPSGMNFSVQRLQFKQAHANSIGDVKKLYLEISR